MSNRDLTYESLLHKWLLLIHKIKYLEGMVMWTNTVAQFGQDIVIGPLGNGNDILGSHMYIVSNNIYPIDATPPLREYDVVVNVHPHFNIRSVTQIFPDTPQFVQSTTVNLGTVVTVWEARSDYR